jgi:hypothetical protein
MRLVHTIDKALEDAYILLFIFDLHLELDLNLSLIDDHSGQEVTINELIVQDLNIRY